MSDDEENSDDGESSEVTNVSNLLLSDMSLRGISINWLNHD